jgi:esterase
MSSIASLHSQTLGQGPDLIILHGLFGSLDNWMSMAKAWATDFTVHLLDARNHGRSQHLPEHNYEAMAADLNAWMENQEIAKAHILGHSMGGKTLMRLLVDKPERVDKAIVVDISPKFYPPHHEQIIAAFDAVPLDRLQSRQDAEEAMKALIQDAGIRQFLLKNLVRNEDGFAWKMNYPVLVNQIQNIGEKLEVKTPIDKEVLFLRGSHSNYIPEDHIPELKAWFTHPIVKTITPAGHWIHAEQPEQIRSIVLEYLHG